LLFILMLEEEKHHLINEKCVDQEYEYEKKKEMRKVWMEEMNLKIYIQKWKRIRFYILKLDL